MSKTRGQLARVIKQRDELREELAALVSEMSAALDDLDRWATYGPETYTNEERARREGHEAAVTRAIAVLGRALP